MTSSERANSTFSSTAELIRYLSEEGYVLPNRPSRAALVITRAVTQLAALVRSSGHRPIGPELEQLP